ncbi:MAG: sigma-70 family RNA polymerase sigma factor [Armatimonadetes bacterium]|nr:sigma-70 family RNA polymerase sigma factor [Armatimonadota bacterium]
MPIVIDIDLESGKVAQVNLTDAEVVGIEDADEVSDFTDFVAGDDGRQWETDIAKRDLVQKIIQAAKLTETQRFVVERHFFAEMETSEIAKMMGVTRQWVSSTLRRSIRKLQRAASKLGISYP